MKELETKSVLFIGDRYELQSAQGDRYTSFETLDDAKEQLQDFISDDIINEGDCIFDLAFDRVLCYAHFNDTANKWEVLDC